MSENQPLEALLQQIRDICAQEYKRGEADAIASIMRAASTRAAAGDVDKLHRIAPKVQRATAKASVKSTNPVPRGLPERFVRRVMSQVPNGISPTDIITNANSDVEKQISYSAIRRALFQGRERGEYKNSGGKWFKRE